MKKFFLLLLVLILLIGGGVFYAVKRYVNVDELRSRVTAIVKEKTGRDITFTKVRVMPMMNPFPYLLVKLEDVSFSNAKWSTQPVMAKLASLEINVALKPLLDKKIDITKFVLEEPVINLEISREGQKNWEFTPAKAEKKEEAEKPEAPSQVNDAVEGFKKDLAFSFSQFELHKGHAEFVDRRQVSGMMFDKIDLTATYPDFSSSIQLDGWFEYLGRRVNLFANIEKPVDLLNGKVTTGKVNIKSDGVVDVSGEGKLATTGTMLDGKIAAELPSLPGFVGWMTASKEQPLPFRHIKFNSKAVLTGQALKLTGAKLVLDEVQADGDVTLGLATPKPAFTARVSLNKLNLDRFTGQEVDETGKTTGGGKKGKPKDEDWDSSPIDFSGLRSVNADLVLKTGGFSLRGAEVGPSTLTVNLKDGELHAKNSEATLFGGKFMADLGVNASGKTPSMTFSFGMDNVDAKPVLTTFADFENLSGRADASVDVASSGGSQKAIIGNLMGRGTFNFKNGSIQGIDFVKILTMIQSRLAEMGVGAGKTDFVDMGGTFKIANGVATNDDLKMRGPLVQATGSGKVDLPQKMVNYRALPVLTASSGEDNAKGFQVPVNIHGRFSNIKVNPDYKAILTNLNTQDVKETVKNVREEGKAFLKDIKKDPNAAVDNLLGIFGKKKKPSVQDDAPQVVPEAEPAPAE